MLCVKEEAIDKTFDEFNEMFLQKVRFLIDRAQRRLIFSFNFVGSKLKFC